MTMDPRVASVLAVSLDDHCETVDKLTGVFKKEVFLEENEEEAFDGGVIDDTLDYEEQQENNEEIYTIEGHAELLEGKRNIFEESEDLKQIPKVHNGITRRRDGSAVYLSKDKNILWDVHLKQQPYKNENSMRMGHVGITAQDACTAADAWSLFITDEIVNKITRYTNVVIEASKAKHSRVRDCKSTTPSEIRAVIGLLYLAGAMKASHQNLSDIYASDGLGLELFTLVMSQRRFMFLLRAMRFGPKDTRAERSEDKLAAIRELFEIFVGNCRRNYEVSEFVTVDEMMEQFRGHCSFKLFRDNDDNLGKYGIKMFAMVCARTFYTSNLEVFVDQPSGPFRVDNSAKSIVKRMIEPISDSGRNVTLGNLPVSFALCAELLINHDLTVVGKLKNASGDIPVSFLRSNRPVGSSMFGFKRGCTLVSLKVKNYKHSVILSSMHHNDATATDVKSKDTKPDITLFHEATKASVSTMDTYKKTYSVARITRKWPMRLFFSMLDVAGLNSFIVLKENLKDPKMVRRTFLKTLGKSLCREHMLSRLHIQNNPMWIRERLRELTGDREPVRPVPPPTAERGSCYLCPTKRCSRSRCGQCRYFMCREHTSRKCVQCAQRDTEDGDYWQRE